MKGPTGKLFDCIGNKRTHTQTKSFIYIDRSPTHHPVPPYSQIPAPMFTLPAPFLSIFLLPCFSIFLFPSLKSSQLALVLLISYMISLMLQFVVVPCYAEDVWTLKVSWDLAGPWNRPKDLFILCGHSCVK